MTVDWIGFAGEKKERENDSGFLPVGVSIFVCGTFFVFLSRIRKREKRLSLND